jgi:hypothetical protein
MAEADDPCAAIAGDPTAPVSVQLECYRVVPFSDAVRHRRAGGRFFDMPPGNPGLETRLAATFPYAASAVRVYEVGDEGDERAVAIELPLNPCPGPFQDKRLIVLDDGIAQFHQALVLLAWGQLIPGAPPLPFVMPDLPLQRAPFLREVRMQFEQTQAYKRPGSDVLTSSREIEPDATIETWVYNRVRGAELDRYGYVYTKAHRGGPLTG